MSASIAFGSPIEELVGDKMVRFARLSMEETATIQETIRSDRVGAAKSIANGQGDKLSAGDRAGFILGVSLHPIGDQELWDYLGTRPGMLSALKLSITKLGREESEAKELIGKLNFFVAKDLARTVVGALVPVVDEKVGKPEERDWATERFLIRELCPNAGSPEDMTRAQYEQTLEIAKFRQQAKKEG